MSTMKKEVLFHADRVHYYLGQNVGKTMQTWRCSQYFRNSKCKALVRTKNGKYLNSTQHSCQPEPQRIARLQLLYTNRLKKASALNRSSGSSDNSSCASFTTGKKKK